MYVEYFGLKEFPFNSTPDPSFFYSNKYCQHTFGVLENGVRSKNAFCVVTGDAGIGKSILLRRLILDPLGTAELVSIIHPGLTFIALMRSILKYCGCGCCSADKHTLAQQFKSYVHEQFPKGRSLAILIDEAQVLSEDVLEQLQLLYLDCERLIPIVLVGQSNLEDRFDNGSLRQLRECITLRRQLIPLQDYEVSHYLKFRLEHAGYRGEELFQLTAIERLIDLSQGIPRLINTLCDNALLYAFRASIYRISGDIINDVNNQFGLVERSQVYTETKIHQLANSNSYLVDHVAVDEVATQLQFSSLSLSAYVQAVPKRELVEDAGPTEYVEAGDSILYRFIKAVRQKPTLVAVKQFTLNWLWSQRSEVKRTAINWRFTDSDILSVGFNCS